MKNKTFVIVVCLIVLTLGLAIGGVFLTSAMSTIDVPDGKMIVLGSKNKYVIIDPVSDPAEITESLLATPTGEFSSDSVIKVLGTSYIATTTNIKLGGIIGDINTNITIMEGSNIEINSNLDFGIDVYILNISSEFSKIKTTLKVEGKIGAIGYKHQMEAYNTNLTASGVDYGIKCTAEDIFYASYLRIVNDSLVDASASGKNGIAIYATFFECIGSKVNAKALAGVSGIKASFSANISAVIHEGKEYSSEINAFSYAGRAIYISEKDHSGTINVTSSKVYGETETGEAGIHSDYIYVSSDESFEAKAHAEGKADIGYGVVGQYLDTDNDFPSGYISVTNGTVIGYVNEGMGLSTNNLNCNGGTVEGVAKKGIGISVCMAGVSNTDVTGISFGSSEKHFQVYESIPDSAGINYLSGFYLYGGGNITGLAPKEDENSYGIHGLLFNEEKTQRSGYFNVSSEQDKDVVVTAKGGVGLYVGSTMSIYASEGKTTHNIEGAVDGIQAESIHAESSEKNGTVINVVGEKGAGIRAHLPINEYNQGNFSIRNSVINSTGVDFGVWFLISGGSQIANSKITAIATSGDGIHLENGSPNYLNELEIIDSTIESTGKRYGMFLKDMNSSFKSESLDSQSVFQGAETALYMEYSKNEETESSITGLVLAGTEFSSTLKAISAEVSPDKVGRKPAVFAPFYNIADKSVLTEEHIYPMSKNLSPAPFFAYALGQNVLKYENYDWSGSSIPIFVSSDGIASDKEILDKEGVVATRKGNIVEEVGRSGTEPVNLNMEGVHNVLFRTKSKKFVVVFYSEAGKEWFRTEYYSGTLIELPEEPKRDGFIFKGWQDKNSGESWDFLLSSMPENDLELIAVWEKIEGETGTTTQDPSQSQSSGTSEDDNEDPPPTGQADTIVALSAILAMSLIILYIVKRRNKHSDEIK